MVHPLAAQAGRIVTVSATTLGVRWVGDNLRSHGSVAAEALASLMRSAAGGSLTARSRRRAICVQPRCDYDAVEEQCSITRRDGGCRRSNGLSIPLFFGCQSFLNGSFGSADSEVF
jgi:hypothetical protein